MTEQPHQDHPPLPIGAVTPGEVRGSWGIGEEPRGITWVDGPVAAPPGRWDADPAPEA